MRRLFGYIARHRIATGLVLPGAVLIGALVAGISRQDRPVQLEQVLQRGELVMLTRNSAATYYRTADGEAGLEYELASGFADYLGVSLRVEIRTGIQVLLDALRSGEGDLIAAGMSITPKRQRTYRFGPVYQHSEPVVIYRAGNRRPDNLGDLVNSRVAVNAGASYIVHLQQAAGEYPRLSWEEVPRSGVEQMLQEVGTGKLDYAIIDSTDYEVNAPYYPEVRKGFTIPEQEQLAWVFPDPGDDSLVQKAREYFHRLRSSGELARLIAAYRDQDIGLRPVDTLTFQQQVRDRLPEYQPLFQTAAEQFGLDWRLLAAVGYQESHWNPDAVSPTGVRGIMMLTRNTASYLNIDDRRNPAASIYGGAQYLRQIFNSLPERIGEPDRTLLGLAAYNIGLGHLEDARILAERMGLNPDRWDDVSQVLPLLNRPDYHQALRYGYARGRTAVRYVNNIRAYYELLTAMDDRNHPLITQASSSGRGESPAAGQAIP